MYAAIRAFPALPGVCHNRACRPRAANNALSGSPARRERGRTVYCSSSSSSSSNSSNPSSVSCVALSASLVQRRSLLVGASLAASWALQPAATADDLQTYADAGDGFSIQVPAAWETGTGFTEGTGLADRKVLAFYPPGNAGTNVNIVITNVAADFTRMGSFGDAYTFGFNLVGSLDRSEMNKKPKWISDRVSEKAPGQEAILEDAKERNGIYYIEYTIASDYDMGARDYQVKKRLLSAVAIGNNGVYNRLYTVTCQYDESDAAKYEEVMKAAIKSFAPPPNSFSG